MIHSVEKSKIISSFPPTYKGIVTLLLLFGILYYILNYAKYISVKALRYSNTSYNYKFSKVFKFNDFSEAFAFMARVALLAEKNNQSSLVEK